MFRRNAVTNRAELNSVNCKERHSEFTMGYANTQTSFLPAGNTVTETHNTGSLLKNLHCHIIRDLYKSYIRYSYQ
jgi:hypothetical protein